MVATQKCSVTSRMLCISVRPYKRALTPVEAYAVMFRSEQDFDPCWLRQFVRTLGLFPTGTRVLLDDGADALVVGQTDSAHQPIVQLLTGDQEFDSAKTLAAFALGLVLFIVTLLLNIVALRVVKKYREAYE